MKVYLVCETNLTPDGGWPVSVFSTREKALEECRRLAGKALLSEMQSDRRIKWRQKKGDYFIEEKKEGSGGYAMVCVKGKLDGEPHVFRRCMYYVEEYALDKPSKRRW